jgi:hypothetical protein
MNAEPETGSIQRRQLERLRHHYEDALTNPVRWCISPRCRETAWSDTDRLHVRDRTCPPYSGDEVRVQLDDIENRLARLGPGVNESIEGHLHDASRQRGEHEHTKERVYGTDKSARPMTDEQLNAWATRLRKVAAQAESLGLELRALASIMEPPR